MTTKEEDLRKEIRELKIENELLKIQLKAQNVRNHHADKNSFSSLEQLTSYTINNTSEMICWVNEKAEVIYVNDALCKQLGFVKTQALRIKIMDLDQTFQANNWQYFWQNLKQKHSITYESAIKTQKGEWLPVEITANFFLFENAEYNCSYIKIISERKQAQAKIKAQEIRENALIKAIPDHIFVMNDKGLYLDFRQGKGLPSDSEVNIVGTNIRDANIPQEVIELILDHNHKAITTDKVQTVEYNLTFENGVKHHYESRAVRYASNLAFRIVRDITERKIAEEKIKAEEDKKNALLNIIPDVIFIMNRNGDYLEMRGSGQLGYLSDMEIVGKNIREVMPPDLTETILKVNQKAIDTGETQTFEYQHMYADKSVHYFESRTIKYGQELVVRIIREITERKVAEEAIRLRDENKKAILKAIPDMIFIMNEKGDYLDYRGGRGRSFINPDLIIGTNIFESAVPKQIANLIFNANQKTLATNEIQSIEYDIVFDDGTKHYYESRSVKYAERQILRVVREITESKLIENEKNALLQETQMLNEELQASEEEIRQTLEQTIELKEDIEKREESYRALISNSLDIIIRINRKFEIEFLHLPYPIDKEQFIGKQAIQLLPYKSREISQKYIESVFETGKPVRYEIFTNNPLGEPTWFLSRLSPIYDSCGQVIAVYSISNDITIAKEAEEKLIKTNEALIHQNRQLNHYSHVVSHNLRAPVANILGLVNVFQMGLFSSEEMPMMVEKLKNASDKLDAILYDLNHILTETQSIQESKIEIRLADKLANVIADLDVQIKSTGAKIETDFSLVPSVFAVRSVVRSIFKNLIGNSIKFRKENETPYIKIESRKVEDYTCISFSDNGLGIDIEKYGKHIFNLYKRFHHHIDGKGIGLYLVKTQVEMFGGKIEVESAKGKGSTFKVYLK
jgi:PAS domain S-box-containing protein